MRRLLLSVVVLVGFACSPNLTYAVQPVCVSEICFEPSTEISGAAVPLHGVGLFRYYGFKVYVAALYMHSTPERAAEDALLPIKKQLVIHYLREFAPVDFQTSGREMIEDNPEINIADVEPGLKIIDQLYQSVKPGDRYAITFVPGNTELALNGKVLGAIPGETFQKAYFGIWLSEHSVKDSLRDALLGRAS